MNDRHTEQDDEGYWCLWCQRRVLPEPAEDGDGLIYIHDDVEHPSDATYDEEEKLQ